MVGGPNCNYKKIGVKSEREEVTVDNGSKVVKKRKEKDWTRRKKEKKRDVGLKLKAGRRKTRDWWEGDTCTRVKLAPCTNFAL